MPFRANAPVPGIQVRAMEFLRYRADSILVWAAATLLFLSLIATLIQ
jgi:hypothetical protein